MKSLLFVGPWPPPFGGIASHLYELLPSLSNIGYDVHILPYSEKRIERKSTERGVHVNHFNPSKFFNENLFQIFGKKGVVVSEHSYYTFFDDENEINYYLIKNKSNNHYLIPEKVEFDYLFFICDDHYDLQKNIINKLKNVSSVLTASELDTSEIKSTDNINF